MTLPDTLTIMLTPDDLAQGIAQDCALCPVARAVTRAISTSLPQFFPFTVSITDFVCVTWHRPDPQDYSLPTAQGYALPTRLVEFINHFDENDVEDHSLHTYLGPYTLTPWR